MGVSVGEAPTDQSQQDLDREEGEIIDDEFEYIISSDEEFNMRQRIKELEAKNEELEKIANISNCYNYTEKCQVASNRSGIQDPIPNDNSITRDINRAVRMLTDASSISSAEFHTEKKRKRRRQMKGTKSKATTKLSSKNNSKTSKYRHHNTRSDYRKRNKVRGDRLQDFETISLDSLDSSLETSEDEAERDAIHSRANENYLNRDKLRFALARSTNEKYTGSLRDRLQKDQQFRCLEESKLEDSKKEPERTDNEPDNGESDNSISLEEQELRLIALKSAVMKKHIARKKRNAEVAYSPTDFDILADSVNSDDNVDLVNVNLYDYQSGMDISPASSPDLNEDTEHFTAKKYDPSEDTKPVDMDIANSESDNETVEEILDSEKRSCFSSGRHKSDIDILHPNDSVNYLRSTEVKFGVFMPTSEMKYQQSLSILLPPPPPPGVTDYNEIPPPPPPFKLAAQSDDSYTSTKDQSDYRVDCVYKDDNPQCSAYSQDNSLESLHLQNEIEQRSDEEEEEEALRALLLATLQSTKNTKNSTKFHPNALPHDFETLPLLPMDPCGRSDSLGPTESILKEAVRRFKVKCGSAQDVELGVGSVINNTLNGLVPHLPAPTGHTMDDVREDALSEPRDAAINQYTYVDDDDKSSDVSVGATTQGEIKTKEPIENNVAASENRILVLDDQMSDVNESPQLKKPQLVQITEEDNEYVSTKVNNSESSIDLNVIHGSEKQDHSITPKSQASLPQKCTYVKKSQLTASKTEEESSFVQHETLIQSPPHVRSITEVKLRAPQLLSNAASDTASLSKRSSSKIVKPNKVINTSHNNKRKLVDDAKVVQKNPKRTNRIVATKTNASTVTSRLMTPSTLPKVKVKKLIITLRASDTETSEDETTQSPCPENSEVTDSCLSTILNNNYYDNASPISLPMDSPRAGTPMGSNSPNVESDGNVTTTLVNDFFEEKLNNFLKNVRSRMEQSNDKEPSEKQPQENISAYATPVAVRHLPEASQLEYRRLVHRMNILEKQKQTKPVDELEKVPSNGESQPDQKQSSMNSENKATNAAVNKSTLVKELLIKNATSNALSRAVTSKSITCLESCNDKSPKQHVLQAYESSFVKTGTVIISNLDKSLKLVEEVKNAKIAKLHLEERLKILRAEIEEVQQKFKREQQIMLRIYPDISGTNDVITTLKQRRVKFLKAANNLGKSIKGEDYRLNDDCSQEISRKSKMLASQIKYVNSLKYSNLQNIERNVDVAMSKENRIELRDNYIGSHSISKCPCDPTTTTTTESETTARDVRVEVPNAKPCDPCVTNEQLPMEEREDSSVQMSEVNLTTINDKNREKDESSLEQAGETSADVKGQQTMYEYISPLVHLVNAQSQLDPNGILCPYELMGQCEDEDCIYVHLAGNLGQV